MGNIFLCVGKAVLKAEFIGESEERQTYASTLFGRIGSDAGSFVFILFLMNILDSYLDMFGICLCARFTHDVTKFRALFYNIFVVESNA